MPHFPLSHFPHLLLSHLAHFQPSRVIQHAPGFDVPDFLSAGPRDILVPGSLVEEAKQVLEDTTGLGSDVP
jgi:predicted esterase